jgi:hypothetical protein
VWATRVQSRSLSVRRCRSGSAILHHLHREWRLARPYISQWVLPHSAEQAILQPFVDDMADPERRPLLNEDAPDAPDNAETLTMQQHSHATSLPKAQLAIIFAIKLSVTLATQQALPYMNEMLGALSGGKSSKVGYLSGLVWAATGIPHTLSVYPWGRISGMFSLGFATLSALDSKGNR